MEPELEQQLHSLSKRRLIQLLQALAGRHPILLSEMTSILEDLTDLSENGEGEASEDWDFSGDEEDE